MKKYLHAFIILLALILPVYGIEEEILLETPQETTFEHSEITLPEKEGIKSLSGYLSEVYYGETENEKEVSPVLRLFSKKGLQFEDSFINSVKLHLLYSNEMTYSFEGAGRKTFTNGFGAIEPKISARFNDNKSEVMFDYNITRFIKPYKNDFSEKISLFYVSHDITPNQTVLLGQGARLPSSRDGSVSLFGLETVNRGLIGRNLGNVQSVGIRNIAKYKYLDYDIGFYDSARYFQDFGKGTDFTGHVTVKPFGISDESKTNLKLGAGYNIGKNDISYNMYSLIAEYDYKKFHWVGEYANADGSNGIIQSQNKQSGMNSYIIYDLHPKLSVIGKFDTYTPNKNISRRYTNEYTAGLTYKPYKNMKLLLNYVKRVNAHGAQSDIILFATRFIL